MPGDPTFDVRKVRLHRLEGFYWVGRYEGFTAASDNMPWAISEPALHQQVRKLEGTLGVVLIERGPGRRMVLTAEGRALHRFVAPYFEGLPGVLRQIVSGEAGHLVLASEPLYVEPLCAEALARVRVESPEARLSLLAREGAEVSDLIVRGEADLGVAGLVEDPHRGIEQEELGHLGLELRVPADHEWADRSAPVEPEALGELGVVVYEEGTAGRAFTEHVLGEAEIPVRVAAETSSASAMISLVRAGVAPAFVPVLDGRAGEGRRTLEDGTIAFDLTEALRRVAGLPRFGLCRRKGPRPGGLAGRFRQVVLEMAGA